MANVTDQLNLALADRYRIERELGAGGMATVYLAHDVKHDRKVALKLLRPELSAIIGAERFLQEIKVTANLQHPHILALYDSGEAAGLLYYVMPYVEGESLRDRLTREQQLPLDEALRLTGQIAAALDYAHRQGVVHRDIKPENILLPDGQALVADFGIALAVRAAGGPRLTETGLSLGTPHYMSPEQATAERELDARSDVYSLGCVLYEMLAGEPPFTGPNVQAIIAKLLTERPRDLHAVRESVPPHVAATVTRALAKLPADRFGGASAFALALETPGVAPTSFAPATVRAAPARRGGIGRWVPWLIAALASVAAVVLATRTHPPARVVRATLALPPEQAMVAAGSPRVALAPDGSRLVYPGLADGRHMLLMRSLDQLRAEPLSGTDGGVDPFFSPDGQWVGFFSNEKLRKVSVNGSPPLVVADASGSPRGAAWGDDGYIYFAPNTSGGLVRVREDGGAVERVTTVTQGSGLTSHRWPATLPGGRGVLFTAYTGALGDAAVGVAARGDTTYRLLIERALMPRYTSAGYLLYVTTAGALQAVRFDLRTLDTTGPVVTMLEGVSVDPTTAGADLAIADDGTLAYASGGGRTALVRVARDGTEETLEDSLPPIESIRPSPDGRRLAMGIEAGGGMSVFVYDLARRIRTRLTFEGTARYPAWHPSGTRLVFALRTDSTNGLDLFEVATDGSGSIHPLVSAPFDQYEGEWSPDGRMLAVRQTATAETGRDIWIVQPGAGEPRAFLKTRFNERSIALSPDGRHLAFASDESGIDEIYVRDFPEQGGRWQVSSGGGTEPAWRGDGTELFFRAPHTLMVVPIETSPTFRPGIPHPLFDDVYIRNTDHTSYGVARDGQSFYMARTEAGNAGVVLVLNWFEELRARMVEK